MSFKLLLATVILAVPVHHGLSLFHHQGSQPNSILETKNAIGAFHDWKLCTSAVHNNLAGTGPDDGPEELRFSEVMDVDAKQIDLVITLADGPKSYRGKAQANGKNVCFGIINIDPSTKLNLDFKFVFTGTNVPYVMDKFFFSVYDLDRTGQAKNKEKVTFITPVASSFIVPGSELLKTGENNGTLSFESTETGTQKDNPGDPTEVNQVVVDRTVTVEYAAMQSFQLTFEVVGGRGGRNFLFAGRSSFVNPKGQLPRCNEAGVCTVFDDPHITVFDGSRVSLLAHDSIVAVNENERSGSADEIDALLQPDALDDKWLVKSRNVSIQARYMEVGESDDKKKFMRAIAVSGAFLQGNTLVVGSLNEQVTWNGVNILTSQTSEFNVEGFITAFRHMESSTVEDSSRMNAGIDIQLPQGVELTINRLHSHVNAAIKMQPQKDGQDGLCGNFNGIATDDGLEMVAQRLNADVSAGASVFVGSFADSPPPTEITYLDKLVKHSSTANSYDPKIIKVARSEELSSAEPQKDDGLVIHRRRRTSRL